MLIIYLVRHGQTEWNIQERMQGWGNSELTENGVQDARLLGKRLASTAIDAIYTSTSKRAWHTADLIAGDREIPIIKNDLFREMSFGDWEGRPKHEIEADYPKEFKAFWETPHLYERSSGESFQDVRRRAEAAYQLIQRNQPEGTILLVSHSLFLRSFLAHIKNLPKDQLFKQPYIGNASLTKVTITNGFPEILFEGDRSHCDN